MCVCTSPSWPPVQIAFGVDSRRVDREAGSIRLLRSKKNLIRENFSISMRFRARLRGRPKLLVARYLHDARKSKSGFQPVSASPSPKPPAPFASSCEISGWAGRSATPTGPAKEPASAAIWIARKRMDRFHSRVPSSKVIPRENRPQGGLPEGMEQRHRGAAPGSSGAEAPTAAGSAAAIMPSSLFCLPHRLIPYGPADLTGANAAVDPPVKLPSAPAGFVRGAGLGAEASSV